MTLINRVLDRQPETEDDLLDNMITFTDNLDEEAWYYLAVQEAANGHEFVRKDDKIHERWTALKEGKTDSAALPEANPGEAACRKRKHNAERKNLALFSDDP